MTEVIYPQDEGEPIVVDLHDPYWAALLAWLWPGAGHFYQRRFAKGFLFMICVLSTYLFGLGLGHGRVVYASLKTNDVRWQYFCQLGVGIPALPALAQSFKTAKGRDPWFVLCERYPSDYGMSVNEKNRTLNGLATLERERQEAYLSKLNQISDPDQRRAFEQQRASQRKEAIEKQDQLEQASAKNEARARLRCLRIDEREPVEPYSGPTMKDGLMAPPAGPALPNDTDVLSRWHYELKSFFELGTLYTVVAGLLNLLAVYDAFVGPAIMTPQQKSELDSKKKKPL